MYHRFTFTTAEVNALLNGLWRDIAEGCNTNDSESYRLIDLLEKSIETASNGADGHIKPT